MASRWLPKTIKKSWLSWEESDDFFLREGKVVAKTLNTRFTTFASELRRIRMGSRSLEGTEEKGKGVQSLRSLNFTIVSEDVNKSGQSASLIRQVSHGKAISNNNAVVETIRQLFEQ